MSIKLMSEVWENGPQDRNEILVLIALADFCNDEGECWPSMESIAKKARMSSRGVQKICGRLVESGWLEIDLRKGRSGCNLYHVKTPNTVHPEHGSPPNPVRENPEPRSHNPEPRSPKPLEPSLEPSEDTPLTPQAILEAVASKNAVTSFLAYRKRRRAPVTETAAKRLASSLRAIAQSGGDPDDALGMAEERNWQTVKPDWYAREKQEKSNGRNGSAADLARRAGERFAARYVDSRQGAGASQPLLSAGQSGGSAGGGS